MNSHVIRKWIEWSDYWNKSAHTDLCRVLLIQVAPFHCLVRSDNILLIADSVCSTSLSIFIIVWMCCLMQWRCTTNPFLVERMAWRILELALTKLKKKGCHTLDYIRAATLKMSLSFLIAVREFLEKLYCAYCVFPVEKLFHISDWSLNLISE